MSNYGIKLKLFQSIISELFISNKEYGYIFTSRYGD